ncbi:translation initiation factor IF-3 [Candidatus Latescibacterota bacterium]
MIIKKEVSLINVKKIRVNNQITVSNVRLIDNEGNQIGIVPIEKALELAEETALDVVEVAPNSKPPVCRIMDYGKYKYEISKKVKLAHKKRRIFHVKEIKMRSEISEHDFNFKIKHAEEFFKRGDKVKFTLVFRGREIMHKEIGEKVLERIVESLKDVGSVESGIRKEGNNLSIIMVPK